MQDDTPRKAEPIEPATPPGHEQTNQEGMTNGVPDTAHHGDSRGLPHDERGQSENAAGEGPQAGGPHARVPHDAARSVRP